MLVLHTATADLPLQNDDYYIRSIPGGLNEIIFNISIYDELYRQLEEEASIKETTGGQWYLIKQIDGGSSTAKIVAQLDLDAWKASMLLDYTNGSATVASTIQAILPTGWALNDKTGLNIRRTINGSYTPFEVVQECIDTYGVDVSFDNAKNIITIFSAETQKPLGAFATRELNLKEINYKGKSITFATRLYAYGKDGMSFADINDGKAYVDDNTYSSRIICAYWKDERYTIAENLLEDAKSKLAEMAIPSRSYDCSVIDLANTNPEMYSFLDFSLYSVIALIDDTRGTRINHQVVETWVYPYHPDKNKVILSTAPPKIQSQVAQVSSAINDPNSSYNQQWQSVIDSAVGNATDWITGTYGGNIVARQNDAKQWYELLCMDTDDIATAKKVWRWNLGGLGYSGTGYNGPYTTAITQDGAIVADFITTGTLNARLVKAGVLQSLDGTTFYLDLDNGVLKMKADSLTIAGQTPEEIAKAQADAAVNDQTQTDIFNKLTNNGQLQGLYMEDGKLYINATYMRTGILSSEDGETFYLDLDNGVLRMKATSLTIAGQSVNQIAASEATPIANTAAANAVNAQTQTDIFNKLTNNGQLQGLYMQDGQLYINASYMRTGTVMGTGGYSSWNLDSGAFRSGVSGDTRIEITPGTINQYYQNYLTGVIHSVYGKTYIGCNSDYLFLGWFSGGQPSVDAQNKGDGNFTGIWMQHVNGSAYGWIHCAADRFEIPGRIECGSLSVNGREI